MPLVLLDPECSPVLDVAFIVDSSGSIGRRNWARLKRFLMSLTSKLNVGQANTHVSAIAYSTDAEVVFRFNELQSTEEVNKGFDGMAWQKGYTHIDKALQLADSDLLTTSSGMRSNAAKVRKVEKRMCFGVLQESRLRYGIPVYHRAKSGIIQFKTEHGHNNIDCFLF